MYTKQGGSDEDETPGIESEDETKGTVGQSLLPRNASPARPDGQGASNSRWGGCH